MEEAGRSCLGGRRKKQDGELRLKRKLWREEEEEGESDEVRRTARREEEKS